MSTQEMVARALLAEKKLEIIAAIDNIRDNVREPVAMRRSIAEMLESFFQADTCVIGLTDSKQGNKMVVDTVAGENEKFADAIMIAGVVSAKKNDNNLITSLSLGHQIAKIMATPIQLKDEMLGVIVLVRNEEFSEEDHLVLEAAESHIDSAIIQGRTYYELQQGIEELVQEKRINDAFWKIDGIRDLPGITFKEKLLLIAEQIQQLVQAEDGAILLLDKKTEMIELSATTNLSWFDKTPEKGIIFHAAESALEEAQITSLRGEGTRLKSLLCLPLIMKDENGDQKIGVIVAINSINSSGFTKNDEEVIKAIGAMSDTGIFEDQNTLRIREVFGQMVGRPVMDILLKNTNKVDFGFHLEEGVTVVITDLRGSTKKAEEMRAKGIPTEVSCGFTNANLGVVSRSALRNNGTVNKFTGDGALLFFGLPVKQEDDALRAIKAAIDAQKAHKELRKSWEVKGIYLPMGIGIYTGEVDAGIFGDEDRFEYTATGTTVNRAERICSKAARAPEEEEDILVCETTYQLTSEYVDFKPPRQITGKGDEDPITVYPVIGLKENV